MKLNLEASLQRLQTNYIDLYYGNVVVSLEFDGHT
jgi:aryl-alcohol dehydrogenase-like predicted oxidoreductase